MGQNTKNRLLMPDINNCLALWLILASLNSGKKNFFQKRQNNCEKLNTWFYAKFPPLGDMNCCISNLSHKQN
jgi:hypothetical protein